MPAPSGVRSGAAYRLVPAGAVIVVLFGGALLEAARTSLQPGPAGLLGAWSLESWRAILADPAFGDALRFTTWITVASTVLAATLAVGFAALLRRGGPALRDAFGLPVLIPHLVVAVVAVLWLGSGGLLERLLGALPFALVRDRAGLGVILVYAYKEAPFLALLVVAAWDSAVTEREEAAALSGAGWSARLRLVVWPAIRAPLMLGCLIVAAFAFGSFEVPLVVGPTYPPTVAVLALHQTQTLIVEGQSRAAAILLVAAAVSAVLAFLVIRGLRRIDV